MKRTNVLLTDSQHKAVKVYAKREGKTLGRMVRQAPKLSLRVRR